MKKLTLLVLVCFSLTYSHAQVTDDCIHSNKVLAVPRVYTSPILVASSNAVGIKGFDGEIFNNGILAGGSGVGGFVTNPGAGPDGSDYSILQDASLGFTTYGAGFQIASNNSIADDFTVPANTVWTIDSIVVFGYQTGSTTTSTLNDLRLQVWDAAPNAGGSVIYGDMVTNVLSDTYWTGVYRALESSPNTQRPVMAMRVETGSALVLTEGTYWIEYSAGGTLTSGPWANPITILGQTTTGNALQNVSGVWNNFLDGGTATPQGFPFIIYGNSTYYYAVNFNVKGANGTLTAKVDDADITSGDIIEEGKNIEFTASPAFGFRVKEWTLNAVVVNGYTELNYQVENIADDITVTVEFERDPEGELYNNGIVAGGSGIGGFVTHPGGGFNGYDASVVQSSVLGMTTYGFNFSSVAGYTVADDFTIPSGTYWTIQSLVFYGYQSGSTTESTLNDLRIQIWNGAPNDGGNIIFGDLVTNILTSTSWTGIYRVYDTDLSGTSRPVMMIHAQLGTPLVLEAGTYWIEAMVDGTLGSGPYANPITILDQTTTGNALQYTVATSSWNDMRDGGTATIQGLPFVIYGQSTAIYTVTFSVVGGHGGLIAEVDDIEITSGAMVEEGKTVFFTSDPDDGYIVKEWKVNDVVVPDYTGVTFPLVNLSEDIVVTVEFEQHTDGMNALSEEYDLFPNPFDNSITITNSTNIDHVVIANTTGQIMLSVELNGQGTASIKTGELPEGNYVITLYMRNGDRHVEIITKK